jgi:type II secretory pathway component PulM
MKNWFLQKTVNEQKILMMGSLVSCLLISYAFIYLPTVRSNSSLEKRINSHQENLVLMKSMAVKVKQLDGTTIQAITDSTQIMTLVEKKAKQHNLKISQIKPLNKQRLLISFEQIMFNDVIRWLDSLQNKSTISIEKLNTQINKKAVNLQITLSY